LKEYRVHALRDGEPAECTRLLRLVLMGISSEVAEQVKLFLSSIEYNPPSPSRCSPEDWGSSLLIANLSTQPLGSYSCCTFLCPLSGDG
jgi:hypothetical protein